MPNNETTTKFKVDISDLNKAMQEAKRSVAVANSEFKAVSSTMDDWKTSTEGVSAKLKQLDTVMKAQKRQLEILENEYNNLSDDQKQGSKAADDLRIKINNQKAAINKTDREINKYNNTLTELKNDANKTGTEVKGLGAKLKQAGDDAEDGSDGFTILKGALADLVADGIRKTIEALQDLATDGSEAYAQFQAATGKSSTEMKKYKKVIENIYSDNFGDSLDDIAEKISKVNEVMGELSPNELQEVTEAAMTLEDTFGMDFNETLRGVQSLMTHFGMTSQDALDLISSGAQNGLNYTDELGDNVSEYAGKFAEAGYSAEDYFQLLENGADGGAYNLDKVNDAINEVTTRIGDGTIEKNLDMFSSGTQDVFKAWQEGKATQKDVIDSIVGDIQGAKTEQDKMNMSAAAFGTMAEDGGTKFIESLSSVGDSFDDVTGKAKELQDVKYSDVGSALRGLGRTIKTELLNPIVNKMVPVVTKFLNWCIKNLNIVLPIVAALGGAFTVLATALAIQGLINGVTKAFALLNGVMLLYPAIIVGLVAAIVVLWNKNEAFRKFFIKAWTTIKTIFTTAWTTIKNGLTGMLTKFKELPTKIQTHLTKVITKVKTFAKNLVTKGKEAAKNFVLKMREKIGELPSKVKAKLDSTIAKVKTFASNLVTKGKEAAKDFVTKVKDKMGELPSKVRSIGKDVVSGIWNGIADKNAWIKSKIKSWVGNVKSWLKKFFKIGSPSRLMAEEIGQWLPSGIAMGVEDNTKPLYDSLTNMGNVAVAGLNSGARSVTGSGAISGGVVNNYNQVINSPKQLSRLEIYRQSKNLLGYAGGR